MPTLTYAYKGRTDAGKVVKGKLEGASELVVTGKLRAMGVAPIEITEAPAGTGLHRDIAIPGLTPRVKLKDLALMSRQMATMIGAGLSLLRTLNILAEPTGKKRLHDVMSQVRDDVEFGMSLSDAMAKFSDDFTPLMVNMVRAGETGGFLEKSLETVATNFEKEVKLRGTVKSAMTYPIIVLCMSLAAVAIMLIFIVPIFKTMFATLGGTLPAPTQVLVWVSEQMVWLGPSILVLIIAIWLWWRTNKNTDRVRRVVDPLKFRLPVFGRLFRKIALARFARNFGSMLASGVPILQALRIVGDTSGNWVIEQALVSVAESVRQGESIAGPLANEPVFPDMVVQMIKVGEDAGSMEAMLEKVALFYDQEVEAMTESLTSLIEPLMVAFLGVVVGSMVVALYMPIFTIATLVK
ncbi:type II secretion system F family protein [Rathayibacter soli]|uniref:type II secretion system F family protein n=1 Tax=Rathayibacter soli TaxID=3144168 RepID=UPI0027E44D69|nr:type II secretion system F family protein [Glaciibacter superstes]